MRAKISRLLLLLDVVVLCGVVLFGAHILSTRVLSVGRLEQKRKIDPSTQILEYYRQYPERYIRITKESWQYDQSSHTAIHSVTLRNSATVPYYAIEVRFSYESPGGKAPPHTETVKIPGTLAALGTMEVKRIKVRNVPAAAENVVSTVVKALLYK